MGSPGPAPMALAAIGAGFPLRQGVAFLAGILCGLLWVMSFAALLLNGLLSIHDNLMLLMQIVASLYILWLAWSIAAAPINSAASSSTIAPGFWQGFVFNLINPKAYAAFVALFSSFLLPHEDSLSALLLTAICCFSVAVFVDGAWLLAGRLLRGIFSKPGQGRYLRILFALLMVLALLVAAVKTL
nr:LysE family transporter [Pseudoteredinibacter isoporae]